MSRWITAVVGLLIMGLALWYVLRTVPLAEVGQAMRGVAGPGLLLPVALMIVSLGVKSWRWNRILSPVRELRASDTWNLVTIGFAGTVLLPARMGEVLRVWLLDRNYGFSLAQAAGTIVLERFLDVLMVLTQFGLATLFVDLDPTLRHGASTVLFAAVLGGVGMLALAWQGPEAAARLDRGDRITSALARMVRRLSEGMSALKQGRLLGTIVALSCVVWSLELLNNWIMLRLYHLPATLAWSGIFVGVAAMSQIVPGGPGYLGSAQVVAQQVLGRLFGVSAVTAISVSLTLWALSSALVITFGAIGYLQEMRKTPWGRGGAGGSELGGLNRAGNPVPVEGST